MNCQKYKNQFDDRLDGRLDAACAQAFDAHTVGCPACRSAWQQYRAVWDIVNQQRGVTPSFGFAQRTLRRLQAVPETVAVRFWQLPVFRWATAVSLLMVIGLSGVLIHQRVENRQRVEAYAAAHHDRLEDFDVIASLDVVEDEADL